MLLSGCCANDEGVVALGSRPFGGGFKSPPRRQLTAGHVVER
jgi:hypothetical protein